MISFIFGVYFTPQP